MKTLINEAINNIKCSIDYAENNEDFLDRYYDIVGDLFTYNNERVTEVVKKFIENNSSLPLEKLTDLNSDFVSDFVDNIFSMDLFTLSRNYDSYGCLYDLDLFGIDAGEQEIQILNNGGDIKSDWIKNYLESKTDTFISGDYAYIVLFSSITVSMIERDCIESLNDMIEDLQSEEV